MDDQIIIALTKGRILGETLPLFERAGIVPSEDISTSRKLIFDTNMPNVRMIVLRGTDVPTYIKLGTADLGVSGKDMLLEHGAEGLYEPLDLGIAKCRLMTAGVKGAEKNSGRIRVATKFVNVAQRYYAEQGQQVDLIKLYGAMELAPLIGLADQIVDIVDTGNTLRANGMAPLSHIADISSRIVVNQSAMKRKYKTISALLDKLAVAVDERDA